MYQSTEHPLAQRVRMTGERLREFLLSHERAMVRWSVVAFVAIVTLIAAWKLWSFGYNALDLAIYRQVATNSLRGDLFNLTIHPHSYLGDHFELFFAFLWPFFALFQNPVTLVFLQAVALGVAVFPLVRIAERFVPKPWHLLFGLMYLANPVVQNMALFEFHVLPFAIPILSFALLAYFEQRYWRFLIFSTLALTVREDVPLVIIGLGVLSLFDRRAWKWGVVPIALGAAWFVVALKLTAFFSGYAQYKFLVYYQWLGASIPEIAKNALLHPWTVVSRIVAPSNLAFLFGVFLPVAYLPLFRLRWLIPVVPIFLQLLLVQSPGELLLDIHYPSLLLPFFIVASAAAFRSVLHPPDHGIFRKLSSERGITTIILVIVILYSMVVIGPFAQSVPLIAKSRNVADRYQLERGMLTLLPKAGTVAGFEALTNLSDQPQLFSLHYVFLGKKQFSDQPYVLPDDAELVFLDLRDFIFYQLLYEIEEGDNRHGYERIRQLLAERGFSVTAYADRFAVLQRKNSSSLEPLFSRTIPSTLLGEKSIHADLEFLGWSTNTNTLAADERIFGSHSYAVLPLSLTFRKITPSSTIRQVEFRFLENGKERYRVLMPLGGGVYPTSDWQLNESVTSNYELLVPQRLLGRTLTLEVRVLKLKGAVGLNAARSLVPRYTTFETLGTPITIGQLEAGSTTR